ncbi:MAG TPA: OB-fold domain-containing protein [Acidimicrobiales bacterium]
MTAPGFPLPETDWAPTAPFWAAAAEQRLSLPRCDACRRLVWYPADTCARCGGAGLTWVDLSGRGTLFSWVVVHQQFLPQYEPPFVTALVAVDEDPAARLATRLVDVDPRAPGLRIDQPVEVVFAPLRFAGVDGEVTAPFWRPMAGR